MDAPQYFQQLTATAQKEYPNLHIVYKPYYSAYHNAQGWRLWAWLDSGPERDILTHMGFYSEADIERASDLDAHREAKEICDAFTHYLVHYGVPKLPAGLDIRPFGFNGCSFERGE
jgi:hypothetical protein